jgi:hypothetical protein
MTIASRVFSTALLCAALGVTLTSCSNAAGLASDNTDVVYKVIVSQSPKGEVKATPSYGIEGTTVNVSVNPQAGYILREDSLQYHLSGQGSTNYSFIDTTKFCFDLPSNNVWISADFIEAPDGDYTVTIGSAQHGSIVASPQYGPPGTAVSLKVKPDSGYALKAGSLNVNGAALSGPPYQFTLGSENVTVDALFEPAGAVGLVESGEKAMSAGEYDSAFGYFEAAYQQDPANAEAVVYSALGEFGAILKDAKVRTILKKFNMNLVPSSIDGWLGSEWLSSYGGETLPTLDAPSGFPSGFINYTIYQRNAGTNPTRALWNILLFWGLIANNPDGFNDLVDDSLASIFSDAFDAAVSRTQTLKYDQRVLLNAQLASKLHLDKIYGTGDIYVGRAELEVVISSLLCLKASLEWLDSYDLATDLDPLKIPISYGDTFNDYLTTLFTNSNSSITDKLDSSVDSSGLAQFLPLRNHFFKDRNNGMIAKSRTDLLTAVKTLKADFQYLNEQNADLTTTARAKLTSNAWIPDCLSKLETALESGGDFYFPSKWPEGASSWAYSQANASYGVNMGNFFVPGYLALDKIFITELGGKAPIFFGVKDGTDGVALDDSSQFGQYTTVGVKVDTDMLRGVFVKGLEQYGSQEWLQSIFPEAWFRSDNAEDLFTLYRKR